MQPVSSNTQCFKPILGFTQEKEIKNLLSFVDVLVKKFNKKFLPQFIENPHSRDSIHARIYLDQRKGRRILLALLFTEFLKFALRKSF